MSDNIEEIDPHKMMIISYKCGHTIPVYKYDDETNKKMIDVISKINCSFCQSFIDKYSM